MKGELAKYVKQGAVFMDENRPRWYNDVDEKILDISNPKFCVLGQIYGGYTAALKKLGLSLQNENDFGFNFKQSQKQSYCQGCAILTECWRREILWRRKHNKDVLRTTHVKFDTTRERAPVTAV